MALQDWDMPYEPHSRYAGFGTGSASRGAQGHDEGRAQPSVREILEYRRRGGLKTNSTEDQEKAIVYNELVANAVAVQTVADQTQAIHELRRRGIEIAAEDLAHFSPYPTNRIKRFGQNPARVSTKNPGAEQALTAAAASPSGESSLDDSIPLLGLKARKSYFPANLPGRPECAPLRRHVR